MPVGLGHAVEKLADACGILRCVDESLGVLNSKAKPPFAQLMGQLVLDIQLQLIASMRVGVSSHFGLLQNTATLVSHLANNVSPVFSVLD